MALQKLIDHLLWKWETTDTYLLVIWYIKIYCLHTILLLTLKHILFCHGSGTFNYGD